MIYGAPQVMAFTIDLHEDLVEMPTPTARPQSLDPAFPDLGGEHRTELVAPTPDGLVADLDAALVQQVFDVAKRKREANVQHNRQANDLRAGFEVLER